MAIQKSERRVFIDAARGISIVLVVLWHAFGEDMVFNGPLAFVRMPLFFFIAGLFATRMLSLDVASVIIRKIAPLLWIFVLWTAIIYLSCSGIRQFATSGTVDLYPIYAMFWDPITTAWFVYAMAIAYGIARLSVRVPRQLTLGLCAILYTWAVSFGDWANPPFHLKLLRLLPVFLIAVHYSDVLIRFVERYAAAWPLAVLVFVPSAWAVYDTDLAAVGPVTFLVSAVGIFAVLSGCAAYPEARILQAAAWIGHRSVYVYLMHRIILTYGFEAAAAAGLHSAVVVHLLSFGLAVVLPPTLGKAVIDRTFPRLISPPWIPARQPAQDRRHPALSLAAKDPAG